MTLAAHGGAPTILDVMNGPLRESFPGPSWDPWRTALAAIFGLGITGDGPLALYREATGRAVPTTEQAREAWLVVGRRGGKSRISALAAVYLAAYRKYTLAPGERGTVLVIAADRKQARVVMRYVSGLLHSSKTLSRMIADERIDGIDLTCGTTIEVGTCSARTTRGYTLLGVVADETAWWRTDENASEPDSEVLDALRPGMATIEGSLLLAIGSPHARRGEMWNAYREHYGDESSDVLIWRAPTRTMNASVPQSIIDRAYEKDESVARAEWGAEFRADIESFMPRALVDSAVDPGRAMRDPEPGIAYHAFCDPAGGSGADSMTLGIAHRSRDGRVILDRLIEKRPPFSPDVVVAEFAAELRRYGLRSVTGDAFGGDWIAERFNAHHVFYERSKKTRSEIYLDALPLFTGHRIEFLDIPRLVGQTASLERRTSRSGRSTVDHPPRGHDDLSNSALGAAVLALGKGQTHSIMRSRSTGRAVSSSDPMFDHGSSDWF